MSRARCKRIKYATDPGYAAAERARLTAWRHAHAEEVRRKDRERGRGKKRSAATRRRLNAAMRRRTARLADGYVAQRLGVRLSGAPPEWLAIKRLAVELFREASK